MLFVSVTNLVQISKRTFCENLIQQTYFLPKNAICLRDQPPWHKFSRSTLCENLSQQHINTPKVLCEDLTQQQSSAANVLGR
jgi:hypothetical protein